MDTEDTKKFLQKFLIKFDLKKELGKIIDKRYVQTKQTQHMPSRHTYIISSQCIQTDVFAKNVVIS